MNQAINMEMSGYCKAAYFNATSDKRAKENIKQANFNGLDIVLKTPIYEFTYKNSQQTSIGMLAQEIEQFDDVFDNFSLVENKDASGKDDDFMSIRESKLIYVL